MCDSVVMQHVLLVCSLVYTAKILSLTLWNKRSLIEQIMLELKAEYVILYGTSRNGKTFSLLACPNVLTVSATVRPDGLTQVSSLTLKLWSQRCDYFKKKRVITLILSFSFTLDWPCFYHCLLQLLFLLQDSFLHLFHLWHAAGNCREQCFFLFWFRDWIKRLLLVISSALMWVHTYNRQPRRGSQKQG